MRLRIKLRRVEQSAKHPINNLYSDLSEQIENVLKYNIHHQFESKSASSATRKIRSTFCFDYNLNHNTSCQKQNLLDITLSLLPGYYKKSQIIEAFYEHHFVLGAVKCEYTVINIAQVPTPHIKRKMKYRCVTPIYLPMNILSRESIQHKFLEPFQKEYEHKFVQKLVSKRFILNKEDFEIDEWEEPDFSLVQQPEQIEVEAPQQKTKAYAYKFSFEAYLPVELQTIGYFSGFGEQNHMGFGMVEVVE